MAKQSQKKPVVATPVVESKTAINRAKRLARHLKQHPNDKQASAAATKSKSPRKASKAKGNFPAAKHPVRDESGKVVGFANYSTFSFCGIEMVVGEKGNLVQNPEIREVWNKYKSQLANASKSKVGRRPFGQKTITKG